MIQFVCDSCGTAKESSETWIVGLAADAVGAASARREVTILSNWDTPNAVHPLAVHFCSLECKNGYVARLFGSEAAESHLGPQTVAETRAVKRTLPIREVVGKQVKPSRSKVQSRRSGRKKSA